MKISDVTFPDKIVLQYADDTTWTVDAPFRVIVLGGPSFVIPVGQSTDLASIPRPFWNIFPPEGRYTEAAAAHDYLYRHGGSIPEGRYNRSDADAVLLHGMASQGVGTLTQRIIWYAVRIFGRWSWSGKAAV